LDAREFNVFFHTISQRYLFKKKYNTNLTQNYRAKIIVFSVCCVSNFFLEKNQNNIISKIKFWKLQIDDIFSYFQIFPLRTCYSKDYQSTQFLTNLSHFSDSFFLYNSNSSTSSKNKKICLDFYENKNFN